MRVLVFVPATARRADDLRRSFKRQVERKGHTVVGYADTAGEAIRLRDSGFCDKVAGRPQDLVKLESSNMPLHAHIGVRTVAKGGLVVVAGWVFDQVLRHPARSSVAAAGTAGVVALAMWAVLSGPSRQVLPGAVAPPAGAPNATSTAVPGTSSPPRPVPSATEPASSEPPAPGVATPEVQEQPTSGGGEGGGQEAGASPTPKMPMSPVPTRTPGTPTPTTVPTTSPPSSQPPAGPDQGERLCLVQLNLLVIELSVCFG